MGIKDGTYYPEMTSRPVGLVCEHCRGKGGNNLDDVCPVCEGSGNYEEEIYPVKFEGGPLHGKVLWLLQSRDTYDAVDETKSTGKDLVKVRYIIRWRMINNIGIGAVGILDEDV